MGSLPIGISGSRAAAILGMSPWATPFSVWQDIMEKHQPGFNAARGFDYEPFEGNASTRWGLAFEDAIIKLAEERAGCDIGNREEAHIHENVDFVTCHIDGCYNREPSGPEGYYPLHEGKTTTQFGMDKWGEPGTDRIPIEYQIQVQHQMLCTGADECIVSVLVFPKRPDEWEEEGWRPNLEKGFIGKENNTPSLSEYVNIDQWAFVLAQMGFFHQYIVPADKDLQALMLDKYRVWWTKYVIGETPPAPANYADIRAMITAPTGTIIVDDQTARWFKERKDINDEIGKSSPLAIKAEQLKTLILNRAYVREYEMCPHDKMLTYDTCHGQCGLDNCSIGKGRPVLDDESTDKWIFRDGKGNKLGSYGRTKSGNMVFR